MLADRFKLMRTRKRRENLLQYLIMMNGSEYYPVIEIAREAGEILPKHFGKIKPFKSKSEFAVEIVTSLDIEVEQFLIDRLKRS